MFYTGQQGSIQEDNDKIWRIKIPKLAESDGSPVDQQTVNKLNASLPRKIPLSKSGLVDFYQRRGYSVFVEQNDDTLVNLFMVVLRVHQPEPFDRYYRWSQEASHDNEIAWVICHRCHQGHKCCGNPAHLFLGNQQINMNQKVCSATGNLAVCNKCEKCGWATYLESCPCQAMHNPCSPDGTVPPCVKNLTPQRCYIDELQVELRRLQEQTAALQAENVTLQGRLDVLQRQVDVVFNC